MKLVEIVRALGIYGGRTLELRASDIMASAATLRT